MLLSVADLLNCIICLSHYSYIFLRGIKIFWRFLWSLPFEKFNGRATRSRQMPHRPDHPTFVRGVLDNRKTLPLHNLGQSQEVPIIVGQSFYFWGSAFASHDIIWCEWNDEILNPRWQINQMVRRRRRSGGTWVGPAPTSPGTTFSKWPSAEDAGFWSVQLECYYWANQLFCPSNYNPDGSSWIDQKPASSPEDHLLTIYWK